VSQDSNIEKSNRETSELHVHHSRCAKTKLNGFGDPETSAGVQRPLAGLYSGFLVTDSSFNILDREQLPLVNRDPMISWQ